MSALLLVSLLAATPTHPRDVALEVRGDAALAAYLSSAMWDAWRIRPTSTSTNAPGVVVRVARLDAGRVHVDVLDGDDVLLSRDIDGASDELLHAHVWLVVKSTVERATGPPPADTPAPHPPDAVADPRDGDSDDAHGGSGWDDVGGAVSASGRGLVDGSGGAFGVGLGARVCAPAWACWGIDTGYLQRAYDDGLAVHAVPLAGSASVISDGEALRVGLGVRAGASMTLATTPAASALGVTAAIGPVLRIEGALSVDPAHDVGAFIEVGVEGRVLRQAWRLDRVRIEEPELAVPIQLGLEWRWP